MNYIPQSGDIFLTDSMKLGARIVKFLQQSPTIYHQIWRWRKGTLEPVYYYHAGMVLDENTIIEQQWKVQKADIKKIFLKDIVIYRFKKIEPNFFTIKNTYGRLIKIHTNKAELYFRAINDLGEAYDIWQIIGKTLQWLTGIPFARWLGEMNKDTDICVSRVARWYSGICDFGVKSPSEVTTKILDVYCSNSDDWEVVYINTKE